MLTKLVQWGLACLLSGCYVPLVAQPTLSDEQRVLLRFLDDNAERLYRYSDSLWALAEPSFQEVKSVRLLTSILRSEGFRIEENPAGAATMFVATYGRGKPIIGLYGEYDADPNAANMAVPYRRVGSDNPYGHGAGHNLLAVGSLGAALAIKYLIDQGRLQCTVRYFGTTAEGGLGGKTYLARDGYFNDLDLSLYWHPSPVTQASPGGWDALVDVAFQFTGRKRPMRLPETNENALDAALDWLSAVRRLRETLPAPCRIHYTLKTSGTDLRWVPDTITVQVRVQSSRQTVIRQALDSLSAFADQFSQSQQVTYAKRVLQAKHEFIPNRTAMRLVHNTMVLLGDLRYTPDEIAYANQLQAYLKQPVQELSAPLRPFTERAVPNGLNGYASDISDASWLAPEAYFTVCTQPFVPMHDWPATVFTGHSIGHKGLLYAAKTLAVVIDTYVRDPSLQRAIRQEYRERTQHYPYRSLLEPGPIPIRANYPTN
ncbi:Aminobenzoyl-glutamate utilization protein B [Fibrisoma limi BUZ 3]|uniref:Aminobenzoyl-glutamate utilization protein B n=1 Tax=Fibrisoma limi BUZ 3 TaxID=1185876 RepID=I2GJT8_9BACT|nr:Aminobenzoyl-glutamate utilization protein B [Fibrisoma limi]CCH54163.1 Aminobenzoyl-glutamate utilization protein B [Fibrisoma limi BUZ 3]